MRMLNRRGFAVALLATLAVTVGIAVRIAIAGPVLAVKQVKWRDTLGQSAATVPHDTTFLLTEVDTTRTVAVYTDDWDWAAIGQANSGVATGAIAARVFFVATGTAVPEESDTIYFQVERGVAGQDAVTDSLFMSNTSIVSGLGSQAIAAVGGLPWSPRVWTGVLVVDQEADGATNLWLAPKFRLRVAGDQSGAGARISGLKCFISYPKRQESQ